MRDCASSRSISKMLPTPNASVISALPTMTPAPPRRFAHAGCTAIPARNREKMNDSSEIPNATANCHPSALETVKVPRSEFGSPSLPIHQLIPMAQPIRSAA